MIDPTDHTMIIKSLLFQCAMLSAPLLFAQQDAPEPMLPAWSVIDDSLGHVLQLTNEQMKQVQLADDHYKEHRRAGAKDALEQRERDIKAVLMPTQYEEWRRVVERRKSGAKDPSAK